MPCLSVIVPIYNVEDYLRECIDSILLQTYTDIELILVDDGSTDACPMICDEYASKDSRIRVLHKANGGLSDARNAGLRLAGGQWLSFIDSDDYIERDMYENMLGLASETDADIVCCGRSIVSRGEKTGQQHCFAGIRLFSPKEAFAEILLGGQMDESCCDKIFRSRLFAGKEFPVGEINEDIVLIPTLIKAGAVIAHNGEPFYNYRVRENSISRSGYIGNYDVTLSHIKLVEAFSNENFPGLENEMACFRFRYSNVALGKMLMSCTKEERKQFREEYRRYYRILRDSFFPAVRNKKFAKAQKLKGAMILMGIYRPITEWRISRKRKANNDT